MWLCYLTQKLLGPMIMTEKLGKIKFDVICLWKRDASLDSLDKNKVTILFHYAILKEEMVDKIRYGINKRKIGCALIRRGVKAIRGL